MARIGLSIAVCLAAAGMLIGCGESEQSTAGGDGPAVAVGPTNPAHVSKESGGRAAMIRGYLEENYGREEWYPKVTDISMVTKKMAIISTFLKWYPRKIRRNAHEICDAVLASKVVDEASVYWGYGEVTTCNRAE